MSISVIIVMDGKSKSIILTTLSSIHADMEYSVPKHIVPTIMNHRKKDYSFLYGSKRFPKLEL